MLTPLNRSHPENEDGFSENNIIVMANSSRKASVGVGVGMRTPGRQRVKNNTIRKVACKGSKYSAEESSLPHVSKGRNKGQAYTNNETSPFDRGQKRTPLSQLVENNLTPKKLSRLRSITSQSPGARFLIQKPVRTPARTPSRKTPRGKNNPTHRITTPKVSKTVRIKLSKLDAEETESSRVLTPLLSRKRVSFSHNQPQTPLIRKGEKSLRTPLHSALKATPRYSPPDMVDDFKYRHQSITSPLSQLCNSIVKSEKIPSKQTPRMAKKCLSSGRARIRLQQNKQNQIPSAFSHESESKLQRKQNENRLNGTLRTPSRRLLKSTASSRAKIIKPNKNTPGKPNHNVKMITSTTSASAMNSLVSIASSLELNINEEEKDDEYSDVHIADALPGVIDELQSDIISLDLLDVEQKYENEADESYDSISSQLRIGDHSKDNSLVATKAQHARHFCINPVALTLLNNGIEDGEALRIQDRAPSIENNQVSLYGKSSACPTLFSPPHAFVPFISNKLSDVMEENDIALLARPIVRPFRNAEW